MINEVSDDNGWEGNRQQKGDNLTAIKKLTKTGPCIKIPFKGVKGVTPCLKECHRFHKSIII